MEASRVDLHNWPPDHGPGGWVVPHGDPINRWHVTAVHARYVAPRVAFGAVDGNGRAVRPRGAYHAYLVDLSGEGWGLEDVDGALLHQVPPNGLWMVKLADADSLARIERYRVS